MRKAKRPAKPGEPDPHVGVAERLRSARMIERFTQDELAREIGEKRSTFSHWESAQARLPLAAGVSICRRLDITPRWLAFGHEPRRPFIPLEELGVAEDIVRGSSLDFLTGYGKHLLFPFERWVEKNGLDQLVKRMLEGGVSAFARRASLEELEVRLLDAVAGFRGAREGDPVRLGYLDQVEAFVAELKSRLRARA